MSAGGDVVVYATDNTDVDTISGALAGGLVGIGGSVGVLTIHKVTEAYIGSGAHVDALGAGTGILGVLDGTMTGGGSGFGTTEAHGVIVQAQSSEDIFHLAVAGAGGFVGVSGAVAVTLIDSDTTAYIGENAWINGTGGNAGADLDQSVFVGASNDIKVTTFAVGAAGGFVGVDVGSIKNDTSAKILSGAKVTAEKDVEVNALGIKELDGFTFSGAGGFVGLSAAVSVWSVGTTIEKNYSDSEGRSANASEGEGGKSADDDAAGQAQTAHGEVSGLLNGFDDQPSNPDETNSNTQRVGSVTGSAATRIGTSAPSQTDITGDISDPTPTVGTEAYIASGAIINAGEDIEVTANEHVEVDIIVGGVAGGFVGVGGSVSVTNIAANASAHAAGTLSAGRNIRVEAILDEDIDVVSFSGSAGFVGLGAAVVVINDTSVVEAYIGNNADILSADSVSVSATGDQTLYGETGQVSAGAVAVGASFVKISVGNDTATETQAYIGNSVDIGQSSGTVGSVSVSAESTITAEAKTLGLAAGVGAFTVNFAYVDLAPEVKASIGSSSRIKVPGDINITSSLTVDADAKGIGASAGGLAVGAMITDVSLGRGNDYDEVEAGVGNNTTVNARALRIKAESTNDLFSDSLAGSGGVVGVAGAQAKVSNDNTTLAYLGDGVRATVRTLDMTSIQDHDIDSKADSYALGLAAGTGAFARNTITSKANVDIGSGTAVTADNIFVSAINRLTKQKLPAEESNLRSGSAALANLSVLESGTDIGTSSIQPFEAVVNIGSGTTLTAGGDSEELSIIEIQAFNDITAVDSVRVESASVLESAAKGLSRIDADTLVGINVNEATLENTSGDVYLTTRSSVNLYPSANLLVASGLIGVGAADTHATTNAINRIEISNATIKATDVYIYAGRASASSLSEPNYLYSIANAEITTFSLLPSINVPDVTAVINETNTINIGGVTKIQALEDVNLLAQEGIGGDDRARTEGVALSLSLIPYGMSVPDGAEVTSTNTVSIGDNVRIEGGVITRPWCISSRSK